MPYLRKPSTDDLEEEQQEEYFRLEQEFPEETLFNLSDLVNFYQDFALSDQRIKDFVEKIKSFIEHNSHQPLHYFQINERDNFCALIFDTE